VTTTHRISAIALAAVSLFVWPTFLFAAGDARWVGQFSQCSYNALGSVLAHFYGPIGKVKDREAFEKATFSDPLNTTGFGGFYGWGPWTSYMVDSQKVVWNGHAVTELKTQRFSLRPKDTPQAQGNVLIVRYAPGEREQLRKKLLDQLKIGPVILWTPYASALESRQFKPWRHVMRADENTDAVPFGPFTHSVTLLLTPAQNVRVFDGSTRQGIYTTDLDTIVSTSAAMTGFIRLNDENGKTILDRVQGVKDDEFNVVFFGVNPVPPTTRPAPATPKELQSRIPEAQQYALKFLWESMPAADRQLKPDFFEEHIRLACESRTKWPWGKDVPDAIFLDYVLPYASLTETREAWRADMLKRAEPIVRDCKTASDAALALNRELFKAVNVVYHPTKRPKPCQSPGESISAGFASCTGLSILLVDACRSVGVPARIVGTPEWFTPNADAAGNHGGNHTWVEIWDGDWHALGASEVSKLDETWFLKGAARQSQSVGQPHHRIYAARWSDSPVKFIMAWDPADEQVNAEDVTDRYARFGK
jgi:transglutaminase-like putative cysteine protease